MAEVARKTPAQACACATKKMEAEYGFKATAIRSGEEATVEYRVFFRNQAGAKISPWHSIPLFADKGLLNMVCEIPRNTRAKFEVCYHQPLPSLPSRPASLLLTSSPSSLPNPEVRTAYERGNGSALRNGPVAGCNRDCKCQHTGAQEPDRKRMLTAAGSAAQPFQDSLQLALCLKDESPEGQTRIASADSQSKQDGLNPGRPKDGRGMFIMAG